MQLQSLRNLNTVDCRCNVALPSLATPRGLDDQRHRLKSNADRLVIERGVYHNGSYDYDTWYYYYDTAHLWKTTTLCGL